MLNFKSSRASLMAALALIVIYIPSAAAGTIESARRLVELLDLQSQLEETILQSVDNAKSTLLQRGVPSDTVNQVTTALKAEMLESIPDLMEEVSTTYAEEFTEDELSELIGFYKTPTGQKFIASQGALKGKQEEAARAWLQQVQERALSRIQEAQV